MSEYDELLPVFVEESQQHLQTIEPDILALEQSGTAIDRDMVNRIFRGVHSIKGASGFFGLQNIGTLSHVIENSLSLLRDGKIAPSSELIDALLKGVDILKEMLDNIGESEAYDIHSELSYLKKLSDGSAEHHKTVIVAEKKTEQEENHKNKETFPDKPESKFNISASDINYFISESLHLYAIKIFLNEDLRLKGKSPYDFINNMESLGMYVDSFLDIQTVSGLSDCLDNDLASDFLFATDLDSASVSEMLGLPLDRITAIDLDKFKDDPGGRGETAKDAEQRTKKAEDRGLSEQWTGEGSKHEEVPKERGTRGTTTNTVRQVQTEEKIRVGVNFLNDLVNLAGELVLGRNQLIQTALPLVKHTPGLNPVLQHISRVTSEMQEKIMQMRMQPVSLIFGKFHRLVRSLAKNHNKEVKLFTYGEDVELDKSIIEGLSDPLTHLVRNSVDHGLESPEEREKAGKPRHGTIELKAYHQGGQVLLVVTDNGRGVDGKLVARKAVEKGLIRQDQANAMSEKDRVRLIFRPGFSTVDQVTDLSGRGVGMDVVMTNIEHLGGTVDIDTKVNKGTKITLVLPLTLAIVSGLLIKAHDQFFILPEVDIDELVRVKPDEVRTRINSVQDAYVLRLRDMLLPLVNLNEVLGLPDSDRSDPLADASPLRSDSEQFSDPLTDMPPLGTDNEHQTSNIKHQTSDHAKPLRILVVKHGDARFGLIVDSIESTEEIVVKPLPRYLKKMKSFSGVSILGNGKVSLILDVAGILRQAAIRNIEETKEEMRSGLEEMTVEAEIQTFLLFDNNTPERFAVPLELISRIERVPVSKIEHIKDRQFLQYHDKKLRLIFLEDYLPVQRPERLSEGSVGIIVPKQTQHHLGIVMNRVINTLNAVVELDTTTIMAPGLFGSAVLDGKITLLPDMYRLFELAAPEWYVTEKKGSTCSEGKCRILLAEDTPFFRMVERDYLTSAGYDVILAENGRKAIQILEEGTSVDAVILDIVMPKMDGWATIHAIRSDENLKHLPVMAVTSLGDEGMAQRGLEAGFTEWELKLNKTRLLEKLAIMLEN